MPLKPVKHGLKVEEFSPSDGKSPERMYFLVQGGEHILSMDENSSETDNKELIEKNREDIQVVSKR